MPLPLTVSCFSKIQIGFTFLVLTHSSNHGQSPEGHKMDVCVCVCVLNLSNLCFDAVGWVTVGQSIKTSCTTDMLPLAGRRERAYHSAMQHHVYWTWMQSESNVCLSQRTSPILRPCGAMTLTTWTGRTHTVWLDIAADYRCSPAVQTEWDPTYDDAQVQLAILYTTTTPLVIDTHQHR